MKLNKDIDKIINSAKELQRESSRLENVLDIYDCLFRKIEEITNKSESSCAKEIRQVIESHLVHIL
jgi:hypothetical protein